MAVGSFRLTKTILVVSALVLCGTIFMTVNFVPTPNYPMPLVSTELVNFGVVGPDEVVSREIMIFNGGREPLILEEFSLSCGCVEVVGSQMRISGGESGKLTVSVRSRPGRFGYSEESMILFTNSPVTPSIEFTFKYFSGRGIRFSPAVIDFGRLGREQLPKTVQVRIDSSPDFELDLAELSIDNSCHPSPWIHSQLIRNQSNCELKVTLDKGHPAGQFQWFVPLTLTSNSQEMEISLHGNIRGEIWASPSTLVIGPVDPGDPRIALEVQLKSRSAVPQVWTGSFDSELNALLSYAILENSKLEIGTKNAEAWKRYGRTVVRGSLLLEATWEDGTSEHLSIPITIVIGPRSNQF